MASDTTNAPKELLTDLSPIIKLYKDGTVERLYGSPHIPPSPSDPTTGVASKDINISPALQARLYLPKLTEPNNQKLPVLVYYHASGFCVESAFSFLHHRFTNILAAEAKALIISVEYRLAPENPLPIAYEDSWIALEWVSSHATDGSKTSTQKDPWLTEHGDFGKLCLGGDSAGANIVHNILLRCGKESLPGDVKIVGGFLSHPYFFGSKPIGKETKEEESMGYKIWLMAYPSAPGGIDNPLINPFVDDAPSLSELNCKRLLVCLAEKDPSTVRGVVYFETVKKSGWKGEVEMVVVEGEDHCFHILNPETEKARDLIKRLAAFVSQ